jgi:hypothetical protein
VTLPAKTTADSANASEGGPGGTHEHAWLCSVFANSQSATSDATNASRAARIEMPRAIPLAPNVILVRYFALNVTPYWERGRPARIRTPANP